ncbi:unnamed protein product, partial [Ectocarpus sp. 8 AP-2014]
AAATVADGNSNEDDGSDTDDDGTRVPHPLPQSLGGGRYLVQSLLGTGSTASTYRCTTTTLRRQRREDDGSSRERIVRPGTPSAMHKTKANGKYCCSAKEAS